MSYTPSTHVVKAGYVTGTGEVDPDTSKAEALAEFNRWYTQELEEAREAGRQEVREARAGQVNVYAIFKGEFEVAYGVKDMRSRLEDLQEGGTYATGLLLNTENQNRLLGITVKPPIIDAATAVESIGEW